MRYLSGDVAMVRIDINNGANLDVSTGHYIGFLSFPRKRCGYDFVDKLADGTVRWSIVDTWTDKCSMCQPFYKEQYIAKRNDGKHTSTTVQFYRHLHKGELTTDDGSNVGEMVNSKKDKFILVLSGLENVNWDNGLQKFECLGDGSGQVQKQGRFFVGAMGVRDESPETNWADCAGWDKDLGW